MADAAPLPAPAAAPGRVRTALLAVQLLFGVHYLAAKWVVAELPPPAWALLRVGSAAVVLTALALATRRTWPDRRDTLYLALCSLFGVVINQALFLEGIARTTPAHSALLNSQIPAFTLLAAVLLREERLSWRKVTGLLAGLAGVLILLEVDHARIERAYLAGDLLNLANAASYGLFVAMGRRVLARTDPLAAAAVLFLCGTAGMALYGGRALLAADLSALSVRAVGGMVFSVAGATVLTYLLNLWALRRTRASRVALYIFLQPLVAAALGAWLLHDLPGPRFVVAAALVFAALLLRDPRPARPGV